MKVRPSPHAARPRGTTTSTATCTMSAPRWNVPVVAARASSTACHSGETTASGWSHVGELRDREERAREQEQRQHPDPHDDRERDVAVWATEYAAERRRRTPPRRAPRPGSRARPRPTGTAPSNAATSRNTADAAQRRGRTIHSTYPTASSPGVIERRHRRVEVLHPLHRAEHRPHRLVRRDLHRARDHQARARRTRGR